MEDETTAMYQGGLERARRKFVAAFAALAAVGLLLAFAPSALAAEDGQITGKVTSASTKAAIAGIEVCAAESEFEVELFGHCVKTFSTGEYSISGLSVGRYGVGFFAPEGSGLNYITQYYNDKSAIFQAEPVLVEAGQTKPSINAAMQIGGQITGKVTSASTKAAITGIEVCANLELQLDRPCAKTNSSGEYTISGIPKGSYRITFEATESSGLNFVTQYYGNSEAEYVTVTGEHTISGIDAAMQVGAQIAGTVTSAATNEAIPGVDVCADSESGGRCAKTNSNGEYTISGLNTGSYQVSFDPPESANYLTQYYTGKSSPSQPEAVSATAGSETSGIDAAMKTGGQIVGKVTSASGSAPVSGIQISVYQGTNDYATAGVTTTATGEYTVSGLATGEYKVEFSLPYGSTLNYLPQYYDSKTSLSEASEVSVVAGSTASGINASLATGGQIAGTVTSTGTKAAVEGIEVCAQDSGGQSGNGCAITNSKGEYTVSSLPSGSYTVIFYPLDAPNFLEQYYNGKTSSTEADTVAVTAGSTTSGINATMVVGGQITGTVTSAATKAALGGIEVCATPIGSGNEQCASTSSVGEYVIVGLATSEYKVELYSSDGQNYLPQYYKGKESSTEAEVVTVTAGSTTLGINAAMVVGGEITGKVTSASTKSALASGQVTVYNSDGSSVGFAQTSASGEYTVSDLPTGSYKVEFSFSTGVYFTQYYSGKESSLEASLVSVAAGATASGVDAAMLEGAHITGKVTSEASSAGIKGIEVCAETGGLFGHCATTDSAGEYDISGLSTADYKIAFFSNGLNYITQYYKDTTTWADASTVTVTAGATTANINAAMAVGGEITGTVTNASLKEAAGEVKVCALESRYDFQYAEVCSYSNSKGAYSLVGLATGTYEIEFSSPNNGYFKQYYDGKLYAYEAGSVAATQGGTTSNINAAMAPAGKISGHVTSASTSDALEDIEVCAEPANGGATGVCASTNFAGEYTLAPLVSGEYILRFASESGAYITQYYNGKSLSSEANPVSVTAGSTTSGIEVAMRSGGQIAGKVAAKATNAGIESVDVCAHERGGESVERCASTNSSGEYTITDLPTANYTVEYRPPSDAYFSQYYNDKSSSSEADAVSVVEGATTSGIDATMVAGGRISGIVSSASTKAPLEGIDVCTSEAGGDDLFGGCSTTNAAGEYTITGLTAGEYAVEFSGEGAAGYVPQYYNAKSSSSEADRVSVTDESTTAGINAAMLSGGEITGLVSSAVSKDGLEGVQVCANEVLGGGGSCASTDSSGEYTIVGLPTGDYTVEFQPSSNAYFLQYYNGKSSSSEADAVSVTNGMSTSGIDAAMVAAGQISGTVSSASTKAPLAGIDVCDTEAGGEELFGNCSLTNSAGEYMISGLAAGQYTVEFYPESTNYILQYYNNKSSSSETDPVTVVEGLTTSGINAAMATKGAISGEVTDATSKAPVEKIEVCATEVAGDVFDGCASTNSAGQYTIFGLLAGKYTVEFFTEEANYIAQYYNDKSAAAEAETVSVSDNATTSGINAAMTAGGQISGTVTSSATKAAVNGTRVCADERAGELIERCASTNSTGEYTIVGLPTGEYTVEFKASSGAYFAQYYNSKSSSSEADAVDVTAGAKTDHIDAAMLGGQITGKVTGASSDGALEGIEVCASETGNGLFGNCASTNAAGEYTIPGLATGEYVVAFYPNSSVNYLTQYYNGKVTEREADPVSVTDSATTTGIDAALLLGGKVAGKVTSASSNDALQGIEVCAYEPAEVLADDCVFTNSGGEYTLLRLPTGEYSIGFFANTAEYISQYYSGKAAYSEADPVAVTAGVTTTEVDAQLLAKGAIAGIVTKAGTKAPLGGIEVCASEPANNLFTDACSTTNAAGEYALSGLETDEYDVQFFSSKGSYVTQYYPDKATSTEASPVSVTVGAITPGIDAAMVAVEPITATLAVTPEAGPASLETIATMSAVNPSGGELTYELQFGDGSTSSGKLPTAPIHHTYAEPGVYEVRLSVSNAHETIAETKTVTVTLSEPLQAHAGEDQTVVAGESVTLDGSDSRPLDGVEHYDWSFDDGTTAEGATVQHVYTTPGIYEAKLTVTGPGQSNSDTVTITVIPKSGGEGLTETVDSGGSPVAGAEVLVIEGDGTKVRGVSDASGVAHLYGLPDGAYEVYVYTPGYLPATGAATINGGEGSGTIELTAGQVAEAQLTSHPMTLAEIEAAGINTSDPANQHVFEFQVHITVGPFKNTLSGYVGGDGFIDADGSSDGCSGTLCVWNDGDATIYSTVQGGEVPTITSLVIPFKASFLKEFYDVSLIVQNLASSPFTLKSGNATISLPNGLSLAPTSKPQSLTTSLPDIPGGGSASAQWILRGDTEGEYNLSATYSATLEPVGHTISLTGKTTTPIHVWGGSALKLTVETDKQVENGYPFHVRVGLTNVANVPVYNPTVELQKTGQHGYIQQPHQQDSYSIREVKPGETYWTGPFILVPEASGEVELDKSFIKKIAGDVTLDSTITTHEREPSLAANPQVHGHRRNAHTITLEWEPVAGASEYQIYRTTSRATEFPQTPDPNVINVGATKAVITDAEETPASYFAISSIINGRDTMVHPLISSTEVTPGNYPRIQTYDETECGASSVAATVEAEDPDFPLKGISYHRSGAAGITQSVSGHSGRASLSGARRPGETVGYEVEVEGSEPAAARASGSGPSAKQSVELGECRAAGLGDSFSSGEGDPPFIVGTARDEYHGASESECHRSPDAYIEDVQRDISWKDFGLEQFVACSGAVAADITSDAHDTGADPGVGPQVEALKNAPRLVTLSIGGDDLDFSTILETCIATHFLSPVVGTCAAYWAPWLQLHLAGAVKDVEGAYKAIKEEVVEQPHTSGARIVVMGYPYIFPTTDIGLNLGLAACIYMSPVDVSWMHYAITEVNGRLEQLAHRMGLEFVNPNEGGAFEDHSVCSLHTYFNRPTNLGHLVYSFHPNAEGQAHMAAALEAQLAHPNTSSQTVHQGGVVEQAINVLKGAALSVVTRWPGSKVAVTLQSPSGQTIDPNDLPADATHEAGPTYDNYWIPDAAGGEWHVLAEGIEVAEAGEPVSIDAQAQTNAPLAPQALYTQNTSNGEGPLAVEFNGATSVSPEGAPLTYEWNYGDGTMGTGETSKHVYTKGGEYTPSLTVRTPEGQVDTFEGSPIVVTSPSSTKKGSGSEGGGGGTTGQEHGGGAASGGEPTNGGAAGSSGASTGLGGSSGGQGSGGVLGFHTSKSPAVVVSGPITTKSGVVSVPLRCAATSGSCAPATVQLTIVEQLRNGHVTAIAATKKSKITKQTVVIGSMAVTLSAGQSKTVNVSLNAAGKKLLAQHKKLPVQVQVISEGHTLKTQTVSIVQASHQARKRH